MVVMLCAFAIIKILGDNHDAAPHVQKQIKVHLKKRFQKPRITSAKLESDPNLYKIKLKSMGYIWAYLVEDKKKAYTSSAWAAGIKFMKFYPEVYRMGFRAAEKMFYPKFNCGAILKNHFSRPLSR